MHRRMFEASPHLSREKNLVLILLAILIGLLLWNSFWILVRVAIFAAMVYIIYILLRSRI
ncbi:MAG: hypothetical protein HPY61_05715 [Methanotrichaceae archaeon]|jgi:hypothetical protein|nr:hypothetical protein [Methanotrichaceae archaeon]